NKRSTISLRLYTWFLLQPLYITTERLVSLYQCLQGRAHYILSPCKKYMLVTYKLIKKFNENCKNIPWMWKIFVKRTPFISNSLYNPETYGPLLICELNKDGNHVNLSNNSSFILNEITTSFCHAFFT